MNELRARIRYSTPLTRALAWTRLAVSIAFAVAAVEAQRRGEKETAR